MDSIPGPVWGLLGTIVVAVLSYIGVKASIRSTKAQNLAEAAAQQQQSDRKADRDQVADLLTRVRKLEQDSRLKDNYIAELRNHIYAAKPPPPPPWPPELIA